jgi:hypothetical protein
MERSDMRIASVRLLISSTRPPVARIPCDHATIARRPEARILHGNPLDASVLFELGKTARLRNARGTTTSSSRARHVSDNRAQERGAGDESCKKQAAVVHDGRPLWCLVPIDPAVRQLLERSVALRASALQTSSAMCCGEAKATHHLPSPSAQGLF